MTSTTMRRQVRGAADAAAFASTVRCAIHTRKSTEEGLEQEFNSLDAQRESAEAFILSQRRQGWVCLPERYDDGGYSGGNMDRPALKRLLADVQAGRADCIVVYKVDRLSRSLLDFARVMEILDEKQVTFVAVTQQLNTTTSMGRLTLHILLSFAQFEREITGERTRDKMRAARRKGRCTGGTPMRGYDVDPGGGKLFVNPIEADHVRRIFAAYMQHESLLATVAELNARGPEVLPILRLHEGAEDRLGKLRDEVGAVGEIETFGLGRIRAIGSDEDLAREVVEHANRQQQARESELRLQERGLERDLQHCEAGIREAAAAEGGVAAARSAPG